MSLFACLLLVSTAGVGGGMVGVLLLGAGLGVLYPFTIRMIGERLPYRHPDFLNGFLSFSLMSGMLGPWLLGHLADSWGVEWAVGMPALGIVLVSLLHAVLLLESRASPPHSDRAAASKQNS